MKLGVRIWLLIVLSGLSAFASAGSARAASSPLEPVRRAESEARHQEAANLLVDLLARGQLRGQALSDAHQLGGELFAALGDLPRAREHFTRWLILSPQATLPGGRPRAARDAFLQARAQAQALGALRMTQQTTRSGDTVQVALQIEANPLAMVSGLRVAYGIGRDTAPTRFSDAPRGTRITLHVPAHEWVRLRVIALDAHGNEASSVTGVEPVELSPQLRAPETLTLSRSDLDAPWYGRWYTYAGIAAMASGAGLAFGLRARASADALSSLDTERSQTFQAEELERRAKRNALSANVAFGTAGLASLGALICLWRSKSRVPTTLVPVARRGGVGVSLKGAF